MKKVDTLLLVPNSLRQKAEEQIGRSSLKTNSALLNVDVMKLHHELEVHQIELEMQNEELREALGAASNAIALYDFAPYGCFSITKDGTITQLNLSGASMLGKERSALVGNNFKFFLAPDSLPAFNSFLNNAFELYCKQSCDVCLISRSKNISYFHLEGLVYSSEGPCLVTVVDVTDRQLAQQQLIRSEAYLRELNASKDLFFSIIAHDLKSPFCTILGFCELLEERIKRKDYEEVDEFSVIIHESSRRALDLLTNLLEWSRFQSGRMVFNPEYLDLEILIKEVIDFFNDSAEKKSISITCDTPKIFSVFADKAMISTVLRNLISNAIKFCNPGAQIRVSAEKITHDWRITVSDTGIGISTNNIAKLFRIGEGYSTKGTQNEHGTGLGLILCKDFVLKHGGQIWVESELGRGSSFYFTIPERVL